MNITLKKTATFASLIAISVLLLLTGCKKDLTSRDNNSLTPSASTATSATSNFTSNEKIPVQIFVYIPCALGGAGESVLLSGTLHVLTSFTINGNSIKGKSHFQPQGISGYGEISGNKYQATGVTQYQFKGSFISGQFKQNYINNFRIVGQGPGNNYLIHQNFHININANGKLTSFVDNFRADCR